MSNTISKLVLLYIRYPANRVKFFLGTHDIITELTSSHKKKKKISNIVNNLERREDILKPQWNIIKNQ